MSRSLAGLSDQQSRLRGKGHLWASVPLTVLSGALRFWLVRDFFVHTRDNGTTKSSMKSTEGFGVQRCLSSLSVWSICIRMIVWWSFFWSRPTICEIRNYCETRSRPQIKGEGSLRIGMDVFERVRKIKDAVNEPDPFDMIDELDDLD